jgi:hypothetical protein
MSARARARRQRDRERERRRALEQAQRAAAAALEGRSFAGFDIKKPPWMHTLQVDLRSQNVPGVPGSLSAAHVVGPWVQTRGRLFSDSRCRWQEATQPHGTLLVRAHVVGTIKTAGLLDALLMSKRPLGGSAGPVSHQRLLAADSWTLDLEFVDVGDDEPRQYRVVVESPVEFTLSGATYLHIL